MISGHQMGLLVGKGRRVSHKPVSGIVADGPIIACADYVVLCQKEYY